MNGPGDSVASPVTAAVAGRVLATGPDVASSIVVEHHYERRVAVEVERNSKGYRWHLSVAAQDDKIVRDLVDVFDTWLSSRFGAAD